MTDVLAEPAIKPVPSTLAGRLVQYLNKAPIHIFLAVVALIWLVPTIGLFVTSFRPRTDIQASGWWTALSTLRFTATNYEEVLTSNGMLRAFINTLIITLPSTFLPLTLASLAAYAFSWIRFPFRDTAFLIVVALMMVPAQIVFIPVLQLLAPLKLTNGFVAIWLTHTAFALPFGIFLLRNFFITLPRDLIEAARMDGASTFGIFRTIVVPLSVPAIAAYGIFQFLWTWNDLLMSLVFVQNAENNPMTRQISGLLSQYGTEWHLLAASAFIQMLVPLAVFIGLQRFFVQGLLAGSVK
ncbi:MAG: carbohydrate ABC transporter permease [Candidatus Limnocylindrales bacterium]